MALNGSQSVRVKRFILIRSFTSFYSFFFNICDRRFRSWYRAGSALEAYIRKTLCSDDLEDSVDFKPNKELSNNTSDMAKVEKLYIYCIQFTLL